MYTRILHWCFLAQIALMMVITRPIYAEPWIDPGDERLRHHLSVLADAGLIKAPITTWPLMWGAVMSDLRRGDSVEVSPKLQWSIDYVRFAFEQARQPFSTYSYIGRQSDPTMFGNFGLGQREKLETKVELDWVSHSMAVRLRPTLANNASDGKDLRLDGSYIAAMLGNWSFGVGAMDRWWGPGWQSSSVLSSNARPVPALMLQRNFSEPFSWSALHWLGPWTFTAFVGQLEADRQISNAKILGARFAFKPLYNLEIGFSRTAQWGGEGRPEDLSSFGDLIFGNDNVGDNGINEENQPGNQLGAVDMRLGGNLFGNQAAAYLQYAGEDESNAFPSNGFYLAGVETAIATSKLHHRLILEYIDTTADGDTYNTSYEHSVYQTGYRYRGRPIGASVDNDSTMLTFAGFHYLDNGDEIVWRFNKLNLNQDGANRASIGGSVFGDQQTEANFVEIGYATIFKDIKLSSSLIYTSDELTVYGNTIDGAGYSIAVEYKP